MSEAPTHASGVPTPARPQQNERTPQTDRMPQQQRADAQRVDAQRTEVQRGEAQRTETQRADAQRVDGQGTEAQRAETQRAEHQRTEQQRTESPRSDHERGEHRADQRHSDQRQTEQRQAEQRQTEQRHAEPQRTDQRPVGKLEDEWQAVQYEFVDDPKAAVRKADGLVTRALEELTTRHRSLTQQLEGNSDPQTEDLRLALHRYRELFKSLVAVK